MKRLFKVNGDVGDPIVSNTILCIGTYLIMIMYTIAICVKGINVAQGIDAILTEIVKCFGDSIIPTTITLVLGIVMQNLILAIENKYKKCAWTFVLMLVCVAYSIRFY